MFYSYLYLLVLLLLLVRFVVFVVVTSAVVVAVAFVGIVISNVSAAAVCVHREKKKSACSCVCVSIPYTCFVLPIAAFYSFHFQYICNRRYSLDVDVCWCVCVCVFGIDNRCEYYINERQKRRRNVYTHINTGLSAQLPFWHAKWTTKLICTQTHRHLRKRYDLKHNFQNALISDEIACKGSQGKNPCNFVKNERIKGVASHFNEEGLVDCILLVLKYVEIKLWNNTFHLVHCIEMSCLTVFTMEALFEFAIESR